MTLKATSLRAIALAVLLGTAACAAPSQLSAKKEQAMPSVHSITSRYSFDDTVARLQASFLAKGMSIFGIINHQAAAQESGLSMQPATVIVFGTPQAGTPLMVKDPEFALQLPLKVLVTEQDGQVKVVFNDTRALIQGSKIDFSDVENSLANAEKLIAKTVTE